eukprot:5946843-Prymnesium_polylepis.1
MPDPFASSHAKSRRKGAQLFTHLSIGNVAFFKKIHVHHPTHSAVFTAEELALALASVKHLGEGFHAV